MEVFVDKNSGYCFGVEYAIHMAEDNLEGGQELYCLGDIVHNDMEVKRLNNLGLKIIERQDLKDLHNCKVLIRAHGEPPETYQLALQNNIELIDASCPVVLKLQNRVKNAYDKMVAQNGQMVIYGKKGHAEVIGLSGQTHNEAIIVTTAEDLDLVDFTRPITLFSQTTKSTKGFYEMKALIEERLATAKAEALLNIGSTPADAAAAQAAESAGPATTASSANTQTSANPASPKNKPQIPAALEEVHLDANDSICRQVSNREPQMKRLGNEVDVVIFVAGKKSSNGKSLYNVCLSQNPRSYYLQEPGQVQKEWFKPTDRVAVAGATSTPTWLMEQVAAHIRNFETENTPLSAPVA